MLPRSKPSDPELMLRKAMTSTFTSNKAHHSELTAGVVRSNRSDEVRNLFRPVFGPLSHAPSTPREIQCPPAHLLQTACGLSILMHVHSFVQATLTTSGLGRLVSDRQQLSETVRSRNSTRTTSSLNPSTSSARGLPRSSSASRAEQRMRDTVHAVHTSIRP
jgi:hypothetical protein